MGLYDDLTADIKDAFDTDLADAVNTLELLYLVSNAYDPGLGTNDRTEQTYPTRGVVEPVAGGTRELDAEVQRATDYQFLILHAELDAEPRVDDKIRYDGNDYQINNVEQDPAGVTWLITGRRV